jgi:hypothetical protein
MWRHLHVQGSDRADRGEHQRRFLLTPRCGTSVATVDPLRAGQTESAPGEPVAGRYRLRSRAGAFVEPGSFVAPRSSAGARLRDRARGEAAVEGGRLAVVASWPQAVVWTHVSGRTARGRARSVGIGAAADRPMPTVNSTGRCLICNTSADHANTRCCIDRLNSPPIAALRHRLNQRQLARYNGHFRHRPHWRKLGPYLRFTRS